MFIATTRTARIVINPSYCGMRYTSDEIQGIQNDSLAHTSTSTTFTTFSLQLVLILRTGEGIVGREAEYKASGRCGNGCSRSFIRNYDCTRSGAQNTHGII